jgi:uncharacterized membrane protein
MQNPESQKLLQRESKYIQKLNKIVEEAIKQERLIVIELPKPNEDTASFGQAISDKVAKFGGSWKFIISFIVILTLWIIINVAALTTVFDPYPFILLNLLLSCIAALQAPVILMSQNRQDEKDRKRSENDYLINLKAELEIRNLHQKIDLLLAKQIKTLYESQAAQLDMLKEIKQKLDSRSSHTNYHI